MKDIFKRCAVLMMALAMVFSMCGCKKDIIVTASEDPNKCGYFTVDGSLGNSGTVTLSGNLPVLKLANYNYPYPVKNQKYTYKRSGNTISFTRKGGTISDGPKSFTGTYNEKTNTFTIKNANYCL